jgi:glycosyltransferase involved in cell wall biosynthesis
MTKQDVVILSTADWDHPFWTNKQHVAAELARRGHRVLYIDPLPLRRPTMTASDSKRILRRIVKMVRPPRKVAPTMWVWSPAILPFQDVAAVRRINRVLLSAGLSLWSTMLGLRKDLLWTFNPVTTEVLGTGSFDRLVYHCVDEIKAQPGMPGQYLDDGEDRLLRRADLVFVTARRLYETRRTRNVNTHYFSNVADYDHFAKARDPATEIPADMCALRGPIIGFIGAIGGYKMDFALLAYAARALADCTFVLIGKVGEGDVHTDVGMLEACPNIKLIGPRAYGELPNYLKAFDVALLPSQLNEYTESMFPMKFFEYLAAGKPVVGTDLHALREFKQYMLTSHTPQEFVEHIRLALAGEGPSLEKRLEIAQQYTYAHRTGRMLELIDNLPLNAPEKVLGT